MTDERASKPQNLPGSTVGNSVGSERPLDSSVPAVAKGFRPLRPGPWDPNRFQEYEVSPELQAAMLNIKPPPLELDTDDTLPPNKGVTAPAAEPAITKPLPTSELAALQTKTAKPLLPDSRTAAHQPVLPPPATTMEQKPTVVDQQPTVEMRAHRPPGLLARWALTGKMPKRLKIALISIAAVSCVVLLSLAHWNKGGGERASPSVAPTLPPVIAVEKQGSAPQPRTPPVNSVSLETTASHTTPNGPAASAARIAPSSSAAHAAKINHSATTKPIAIVPETTQSAAAPTVPSETPSPSGKRPLLVPR